MQQNQQELIQWVKVVKEGGKTVYFGKTKDTCKVETLKTEWLGDNFMNRRWRKKKLFKKIDDWVQVSLNF